MEEKINPNLDYTEVAPDELVEAQSNWETPEEPPLLTDPALYINHNLSHLQFNLRVLAQSLDEEIPLIERLRFLLIFSSNMDEFYEIRVAELHHQVGLDREIPGKDGLPVQEVLRQINLQCHEAYDRQYEILNQVLIPQMEQQGIRFLGASDWTEQQAGWVRRYFRSEVMPLISPLGLDPAHPFPRLVNKSLNFILSLEGKDAFGRESGMAIVPAPRSLPRLFLLADNLCEDGHNFVLLSEIITAHADELFQGMTVKECHPFRVTRNADLEVNAEEVEDIALALRGELHLRRFGAAVKLEISSECPERLCNFLLERFSLSEDELFRIDGPVNLQRLSVMIDQLDRPDLCYQVFTPMLPNALKEAGTIFETLRREDYLLLHPYQSFAPVIDLLRQAARDPQVVVIKQTLYRTGEASELVELLAEAARNGKEVTVVIELRARFDEEENLNFAGILQEAGALVLYGVVGHKTHAKAMLVIRRESRKLVRYAHLSTGNYHPRNARVYTDYSLLTANQEVCKDVAKVFQQLTGMGKAVKLSKLLHAPFTLHKQLLQMIDQEAEAALAGNMGHIIAKVNGLTERKIIKALYRASQAGVKVDLIVRGMCCLRPGVPGVSDNIRVISIVGRFLEHSRAYYFRNAAPQVYCSSADLMERNLLNRVEVCFPILSEKLANRVKKELELFFSDNCQSWNLNSDGRYVLKKTRAGQERRSVQEMLLERLAV
ncbi:MAG: polyphosphate kinase 1 [Halieaceae bacterium]|nr:polyphosphate kinase 1 [Halieaceae bacterium]